jgi:hypothetical protein
MLLAARATPARDRSYRPVLGGPSGFRLDDPQLHRPGLNHWGGRRSCQACHGRARDAGVRPVAGCCRPARALSRRPSAAGPGESLVATGWPPSVRALGVGKLEDIGLRGARSPRPRPGCPVVFWPQRVAGQLFSVLRTYSATVSRAVGDLPSVRCFRRQRVRTHVPSQARRGRPGGLRSRGETRRRQPCAGPGRERRQPRGGRCPAGNVLAGAGARAVRGHRGAGDARHRGPEHRPAGIHHL